MRGSLLNFQIQPTSSYKFRKNASNKLLGILFLRNFFPNLYIKKKLKNLYFKNKIFRLLNLYTCHQTIQNLRIRLPKFDNAFLNYKEIM